MANLNSTGMSELERAWVRARAEAHFRATRGEPRAGLREAWLWVEDLWCRATAP